MRLEVDLYSGRPNPAAALDEAIAGELLRRVGALRPAPALATSPGDGLGYRGLRATFTAADRPAQILPAQILPAQILPAQILPAQILVSGGTVVVRAADGGERRLADPGRALERWLIEAAAGDLDADATAAVRADLDR